MKKLLFILFISIGILQNVNAQTITGVVTGADDGGVLPGVNVMQKGTSLGTITDFDGKFSIEVSGENPVLIFSFVGYITKELEVAGQTNLNVILNVETTGLDEVVVIGYGTVKKKDLTGAVSVIDSETITDMKPVKIEQALQGTIAGVNVTSQSGAPGAGLDIRIRGVSTNGDASPLAIIDGYQGDLGTLNPDDIETITVLKDAQAAIYGTIGANGVILITTKTGKKNTKPKVSINSSFGIQKTSRMLPVLNATEYAVLLNESYAAGGQQVPFVNIAGLGKGTDWQEELFTETPIMNNNINVSGGSENVVYSLSASNLSQEGIIGAEKTGYNRNTARLNIGVDITKWLKMNSSITYTHIDRKTINDFALGSVLFNAVNLPSTVPVYDTNGDYFFAPTGDYGGEIINPLQQIANTNNDYDLNKFNGNFGLTANVTENITANARIGFNTTFDKFKEFAKEIDYGGSVFDIIRSNVHQNRNNFNDYTFDAFVTYDDIFFDAHHVTFTLGNTVYKEWGHHLGATGFDIPYNSWEYADIALANGLNTTKATESWAWDQRRLSYFARLQYDYKGKYLVSAMLRRDASTKFGPDNAVAYFPSATLGWLASEESFINDFDFIDLLKIRASYGILGSDKIDNYKYISQLDGEAVYVFNEELVLGKAIGALPNPSVKWEQSEQIDVGIDINLFGRLEFTADYYMKTTKDLLVGDIPVSGILGVHAPGATSPTVNAGTVRNSGFELALGFKGSIAKDLFYSVNYNVTQINNEVLEVNNGTGFIEGGAFSISNVKPARMEVGYPIGYFYGYETDGIFQNPDEVAAHPSQLELGAEAQPGDIRFKDTDNDGDIDTDDRTMIGSPIPDFVMGLNLSLQYKGFDFVCYFYSSIGNEIVRNYERTQPNVNRLSTSMNRWTGEGTSNKVPRLTTAATANTVFSDYYVENGSFLRLQNLQFGYTLPPSISQKARIEKVRIFASGSNLFTLTKYMGFDPASSTGEPIGSGFDLGYYPTAKVYTLGLNINF